MAEKLDVPALKGWVLISREEVNERRTGNWHIAWHEPFGRKSEALHFAARNGWQKPYRAVRGELSVCR